MTKPQGFLATFRIDEELWGKFKDIAKNKQTNASALIIQYIQGVVNSGGVDNVPQSAPQNIDNFPTIQNIEDLIDARIGGSIRDGDIKYAIAASYTAVMGQFNGLLEELQALQKQVQELKSIPPAAVPQSPINEQLTTDNEQFVIDNYQLDQEIGNRELGIGEHEDVDLIDSDLKSDTQLPMTDNQLPPGDDLTEIKSDNSPALPVKSQTDHVQKQLKKIGIKKTAAQIRESFIDLGFDGTNYNQVRDKVIEILSDK
ncbi:MAG: hypothetical protein ACKPKB_24160 [Dolichospermum sp.]